MWQTWWGCAQLSTWNVRRTSHDGNSSWIVQVGRLLSSAGYCSILILPKRSCVMCRSTTNEFWGTICRPSCEPQQRPMVCVSTSCCDDTGRCHSCLPCWLIWDARCHKFNVRFFCDLFHATQCRFHLVYCVSYILTTFILFQVNSHQKFGPFDTIHHLRHCCCGYVDISLGFSGCLCPWWCVSLCCPSNNHDNNPAPRSRNTGTCNQANIFPVQYTLDFSPLPQIGEFVLVRWGTWTRILLGVGLLGKHSWVYEWVTTSLYLMGHGNVKRW